MSEWSKEKKDSSLINGGKEFTTDDNLTVAELNAMVNNSFYAVDFAEAMADEPDISEIAGDGVPSVSFVENGKFKRLKFSNLKGSKGDKGEKGEAGEAMSSTVFELELEILKTSDNFSSSFNPIGEFFTSKNFSYGRYNYKKITEDVFNSIITEAKSKKQCYVTIGNITYTGESAVSDDRFDIYIYKLGLNVNIYRNNIYFYQFSNSNTTKSLTLNNLEFKG